jgi:hypothetical protein
MAKMGIQNSADTFVVNQSLVSTSTFVVKITAFAKPQAVSVINVVRTTKINLRNDH